jgi:hypothetical protein
MRVSVVGSDPSGGRSGACVHSRTDVRVPNLFQMMDCRPDSCSERRRRKPCSGRLKVQIPRGARDDRSGRRIEGDACILWGDDFNFIGSAARDRHDGEGLGEPRATGGGWQRNRRQVGTKRCQVGGRVHLAPEGYSRVRCCHVRCYRNFWRGCHTAAIGGPPLAQTHRLRGSAHGFAAVLYLAIRGKYVSFGP